MPHERVVCLNCIDGRAQMPAINWIKDNFHVDYVDMITEPGMDALLAGPGHSIEEIKRKVNLSLTVNKAAIIFVVGHHDCKANPVKDSDHKKHLQLAVERLKKEFPQVDAIGCWVNKEWKGESL